MAKDKSIKKYTYHLSRKGDKIKADFNPIPENIEEISIYLNMILAAMPATLTELLKQFPMLRAPTQTELDNQTYFFLGKDAELYKVRKNLYETCTRVFTATLADLFKDIEYCKTVDAIEQDNAFTKSPEELKDRIDNLDLLRKVVEEEVSKDMERLVKELNEKQNKTEQKEEVQ